jgi:hypothetical protein
MPPRPSATASVSGPAISQPFVRSPGRVRTRNVLKAPAAMPNTRTERNKVARPPLTKRAARAYDFTKCVLRRGKFA